MRIPSCVSRRFIVLVGAVAIASITGVSAHFVRGLDPSSLASAFVSSPSAGTDALIPVGWGTAASGQTALRVGCFYVANTSEARPDRAAWPRVTGVGFELPASPRGFSLLEPLDGNWSLVEGVEVGLPDNRSVTLDFAVVARVNPIGHAPGQPQDPLGLPPGQPSVRGAGTRFCVAGPFPDTLPGLGATTIERLINGVVVGFNGVDGSHQGQDVGVWFPPPSPVPPNFTGPGPAPRPIPLYD